jgi:hypothetical protein
MTNTINAAVNPALANKMAQDATAEKPEQKEVKILAPLDTAVALPGGYITPAGEVVTVAEVRELTGKDEEAISRSNSIGKAILTVLQRGTVKIGDTPATEDVLDRLLSGDRDMLILGIFKATFGNTTEVPSYCMTCDETKVVEVDLNQDIKIKVLTDPVNDRVFTVKGKNQELTVQLPTGVTQKELILNSDKTAAELNTILLENTVIKIGNSPVLSKLQVQNLGLVDRRNIIDEINKRVAGPIFDDIQVTCPECDSEVTVPINLGALFRF